MNAILNAMSGAGADWYNQSRKYGQSRDFSRERQEGINPVKTQGGSFEQRPHSHIDAGHDVLLKKPKELQAPPQGQVKDQYLFSDAGGALYEKAEAYTKYAPKAVHVSSKPVRNGSALKTDDKILINQKSILEYEPIDQVIQTHPYVAGKQKMSEADRILQEAKEQKEALLRSEPPKKESFNPSNYVLAASAGGAVAGLASKNFLLTGASLLAGAGALFFNDKISAAIVGEKASSSAASFKEKLGNLV